jgi:hypothetical protein
MFMPKGTAGIKIPGVALRINVNMFFDRSGVINALTDMEKRALTKGSMRIKDRAKRSIKKQGMAKPALKIMKDNPGLGLNDLLRLSTLKPATRRAIQQRIREIKTKPPSAPGTPPHTHVPYGHMLGFRRNLWNVYDLQTHSAVVGPSQKGRMLPYLHEFGGSVTLKTWVFKPQIPTKSGVMRSPIIWKLPAGHAPGDQSKWQTASGSQTVKYPARPFMYPALLAAISSGDLAKAFGGAFSASQQGRGVSISGK